ncbi:MAG: hypothetical protein ABJC33_05560 [Betaproteobacteria bacterium]
MRGTLYFFIASLAGSIGVVLVLGAIGVVVLGEAIVLGAAASLAGSDFIASADGAGAGAAIGVGAGAGVTTTAGGVVVVEVVVVVLAGLSHAVRPSAKAAARKSALFI